MRIEGVPNNKASLLNRFAYWFSRRQYGKVAEPLKVTAHHRWVSFGSGMFELAGQRARLVEPRLKGLAQIKAATLIGCPF